MLQYCTISTAISHNHKTLKIFHKMVDEANRTLAHLNPIDYTFDHIQCESSCCEERRDGCGAGIVTINATEKSCDKEHVQTYSMSQAAYR